MIYMIGFIIYSAKIPEKVLYNYTDYIGNSHQIWHILSFVESYLFHEEIIKYIIYSNENGNLEKYKMKDYENNHVTLGYRCINRKNFIDKKFIVEIGTGFLP